MAVLAVVSSTSATVVGLIDISWIQHLTTNVYSV